MLTGEKSVFFRQHLLILMTSTAGSLEQKKKKKNAVLHKNLSSDNTLLDSGNELTFNMLVNETLKSSPQTKEKEGNDNTILRLKLKKKDGLISVTEMNMTSAGESCWEKTNANCEHTTDPTICDKIENHKRKRSFSNFELPDLVLSTEKVSKKTCRNMASLLRTEVQKAYDPTAGADELPNVRHSKDHIGRSIRQGAYTIEEQQILKSAILNYFKTNGWDEAEGWTQISTVGTGRGYTAQTEHCAKKKHWQIIGRALPQRPLQSIVKFSYRRLFPWKSGQWTEDEEKDLIELVGRYGPQWTRFGLEHFHRMPNYIHMKWKEISPRVAHQINVRSPKKHLWTKKEDLQLLTSIRLVTGVPLPYRAVPWCHVQRSMPNFAVTQLARRYKLVLFPAILAGQYKGAKRSVVFRQFLRYARRGIQAGVFKDISEIDMRRVVPFWSMAGYKRWLTNYVKKHCPCQVHKAPFNEVIEFVYKMERCDKKEKHDLKRLAKTFQILQKINGFTILKNQEKGVGGILSDRFKSIETSDQRCEDIKEKSPVHQESSAKFAACLFKNVNSKDDEKDVTMMTEVGRPLSASLDKVEKIVPQNKMHIPDYYPVHLDLNYRKQKKEKEKQHELNIEKQAVDYSRKHQHLKDDTKVVSSSSTAYFDFHFYEALGILNSNMSALEKEEAIAKADAILGDALDEKDIDNESNLSSETGNEEFDESQTAPSKRFCIVNDKKLTYKDHPWMAIN